MKKERSGQKTTRTSKRTGRRGPDGEIVLTTKDAARLCKVALSTVVYWFDKGLIKGYKTPGGHRRIFLKDLHEFMRIHGIPITGRLPGEKYRILVVDDQPEAVEFFKRTLESLGDEVEVAVATNGFQAGRLLATFQPNLVFLDIVMPTLDGFEVCKIIQEENRFQDVEIIAITGHGTPQNVQKILEAGASMVLTKPVRVEDIKSIVRARLLESQTSSVVSH